MATLSRAESKAMYSWWWDSHISPKNSKWLQENLTDMDSKVKTMIKLIEVDEDSFARRAEMYYKKRPELMKLVEEFYRAYRALAERYDHATGVIQQAHRTMAEAFPNQVLSLMTDDGPVNLTHNQTPVRASFDPDELLKGTVGVSSSDFLYGKGNGDFMDDSSSLAGQRGLKQLSGFGKGRKHLNFHEVEEKEEGMKKNDHVNAHILSESERLGKSGTDIQALEEVIAELEAEKEAGLLQYQQTLERLSQLDSEVSRAKENSKGLSERVTKAEAEVQSLKETLAEVEAEREANLLQYHQCLDRVANLESYIFQAEQDAGQLSERACKAEKEIELLKDELTQLKAEKEVLLAKYMEALEKIANLENKLLLAEDYASRTSDRADRAEKEVETWRETINILTEEKEAAVLKCEQCLEKMANKECEITHIQEEAVRLRTEVQDGAAKLKGSEEQCLLLDRSNKSLQSELDSLVQKVGIQNQELFEKQKEFGRLWTSLLEERMRFMEAEAALQSLQNLHSEVQEELRSVAAELRKKVQHLSDMEIQNQHLEDEVQKVKNENKGLNDLNLSSAVLIKGMQEEIFDLKEGKEKLKQELEFRLDQRNALQQEIYCLREELSNLNQRHRDMMGQMKSLGFPPESFGSSVKELLDENSRLKESCQRNNVEISSLAEKLGVMEKLIEKNRLLENSLLDLQAELEGAREKVKVLEDSLQLLLAEKSALGSEKATLITQLQITTDDLDKLSERNTFLESSLFDANVELEMLRTKSKNWEDSCVLLNDQNSVLVTEKQTLASQLETIQKKLDDLGKRHADLELWYSGLEEERTFSLQRVEELLVCVDVEKREHDKSSKFSQTRIADLENQTCLLQEVGDHMREEFEEEQDNAVNAQFDIFILQKCIQDLNDKNSSLLQYCEKLLEASKLSDKRISELEHTSIEQQEEVRVLSCQTKRQRTGLFQLLVAIESDAGLVCDGYNDEDKRILQYMLGRLESIKTSLCDARDENQELVIQKSVLVAVLGQLKRDAADLNTRTIILRQEIGSRNEQLLLLQKEMQKLLESNEELILKDREGNQKEVVLLTETESLKQKVFNLQRAYEDLQKENCKVIEDKESLMKAFGDLVEEKSCLEHECSCIVGEAVAFENLFLVFKNVISDKAIQVVELTENIDRLCNDNGLLEEKVRIVEWKLEEVLAANVSLEVSFKKSENELEEARAVNDQLKFEIANGKDLLSLKEMKLLEAEAIKVNQENRILELSENYAEQLKECESLREVIKHLDSQMSKMSEEYEESEASITVLNSELQKGKDEVKLWETVAGTFFIELQSSGVREALIKEKHSELIKAYKILEEESYSKCMDIVQLRERVGIVEGENLDIKAQLAVVHSAILSLRDSVASLEKHTIYHKELHKTDNEDKEDVEHCQNLIDNKVAGARLSGFADLQEVQARIQAVEKGILELKRHAKEEYSTVRSDLDLAIRQIEVLKSQSGSRCGSGGLSKRFASRQEDNLKNDSIDGCEPQKTSSNISEPANELLMRDIMLDQVSDWSSYVKNRKANGSDDHILELWEITNQEEGIDLSVGKNSHLEAVKENKSSRPSLESMVDKELCVDDQWGVSKKFSDTHQDDYKRKTLERLTSDVQKLTNLKITVQDLKEKLEMTENFSSKDVESDGIKDQLVGTEETISKLFDYSAKLRKKIEDSPSTSTSSSFDGSLAADSLDGGSSRRRRCSEHARRISEKIGRLQLEVQKVQFLLMKIDNNKAGKSGSRITEYNTQTLLRDYLYGGGLKAARKPKRSHFCGCVQPATKGD